MIVGLDISYTSTGIALLMADGELETRRITPKADTRAKHFATIFDELGAIWQEVRADIVVIEEPFISAYGSTLEKILGAHGVALASLAFHGVDAPVLYVHPTTLKKLATGNGGSDKEKVKDKIEQVTGLFLQHDEADAAALAIIGEAIGEYSDKDSFAHITAPENNYLDIKTNALEDAIWERFGLKRADLEAERKRKAAVGRRVYKDKIKAAKRAAKEAKQ